MRTEITDSSKYSKCLVRKRPVVITPEEEVRQALIRKMIDELGFPRGLISVERAVGTRRYDLLCYTKEMTPLLLIECKAEKMNDAAIRQAFGYNATLKAPFICIACPNGLQTMWMERGKVASVPFLPKFSELYDISKRL